MFIYSILNITFQYCDVNTMLLMQNNTKIKINILATEINIFWHYENNYFQHENISQLNVCIAYFGSFQFNWTAFIWHQSVLPKILFVLFPVYNTSNSNTREILHISLQDPCLDTRNDRWDLWQKRILSVHTAQGQEKKSTSSTQIFTCYCRCNASWLIKPESSSIVLHV